MNPTDPAARGEESLPDLEFGGVVDGGLGAQRYPVIVILVDPLVLVVGVRDFDGLGAEAVALVAGQDVEPGRGPLTAPTALGASRSGWPPTR
jgi:hypothetical protein